MSASDGLLAAVRELHAEHWSNRAIARELGVGKSSVVAWLAGTYVPKEDTAQRALSTYRDNVGEDDSKPFPKGTRYETLWMPRSFDIATDLAYWQSQHPNADSFHVNVNYSKGEWASTHSLPGRDSGRIMGDVNKLVSKYLTQKGKRGQDMIGIEFVAVYL